MAPEVVSAAVPAAAGAAPYAVRAEAYAVRIFHPRDIPQGKITLPAHRYSDETKKTMHPCN